MLAIFPARIRGKIAGILAKAANMPDNPLPVGMADAIDPIMLCFLWARLP